MDKKNVISIAVLGCGTIGGGVARACMSQAAVMRERIGAGINLSRVVEIDPAKVGGLGLAEGVWTKNVADVWNDESISIVVELIGGTTIAKDFVLKAIECGKHVVTANKALLAKHGREIFEAAEKKRVQVRFEASVAGGIPIIKALVEGYRANEIKEICGIINGTCNYILTKMQKEGLSFDKALAAAQKKGYAEADPTMDISGMDSAHKIAIMASIADGTWKRLEDVTVEGIENITHNDIKYAAELGFCIKLLGILKCQEKSIAVRVHPAIVAMDSPLAWVNGSFNAVYVEGDIVGETMLYGKGAGANPTASAVMADVLDIARDVLVGVDGVRCGQVFGKGRGRPVSDMGALVCSRYLRIMAVDSPGVLSQITGILGSRGISIERVIQKEKFPGGIVPIILLTHKAQEDEMQKALKEIREQASVKETFMIREHDL